LGLGPDEVLAMADSPVGAYVHVPFCERICPFCPYNKVVPRADQPDRYFAALGREIEALLRAGAGGSGGFPSLYVGGGTPTLYPDRLGEVLARIPVTGERAIEVLPTHATPPRLESLASLGFTAVSIGAQSFSDEVLRCLRRPHDAATARAAVRAAVGRFDLVDVDLIVDVELDERLAGRFLRDLDECFRLGADQVSTYPLMRFGYTPFGRAAHDRRREHEVLAEATRIAHAHGYERRSVWTFNRRGAGTYTSITRRRFLGLGAGASSFLGRDFLVNHFGVETYIAAVESGRLPIARWLHLGQVGGVAYDGFWQAYAGRICPAELDPDPLRARSLEALLVPLAAAGLLRRTPGAGATSFALTERGFDHYHDLERWVTYRMIEPLWGQMLAEHEREGAGANWATPGQARSSPLWRAACLLFERQPVTPASDDASAPLGAPARLGHRRGRGTTRPGRRVGVG
jgi:coproporphyrinogen III oxidase-like Fe-S oxidoreductase